MNQPTKDNILAFVEGRIIEKIQDRQRPAAIFLNEITGRFGKGSTALVKELITEKKLYWRHTINSIVISTMKDDMKVNNS